jgi:hypothetical protein
VAISELSNMINYATPTTHSARPLINKKITLFTF